jgi:hypothetical protein
LRPRISLSPADSFCAKLAKDRKARGGGVVSKEGRPYKFITLIGPNYYTETDATPRQF